MDLRCVITSSGTTCCRGYQPKSENQVPLWVGKTTQIMGIWSAWDDQDLREPQRKAVLKASQIEMPAMNECMQKARNTSLQITATAQSGHPILEWVIPGRGNLLSYLVVLSVGEGSANCTKY